MSQPGWTGSEAHLQSIRSFVVVLHITSHSGRTDSHKVLVSRDPFSRFSEGQVRGKSRYVDLCYESVYIHHELTK